MLNKIKVYDLKEYVEREKINGKEYTAFDFSTGIGIIEGTKGVIVTDSEGVGYTLNNIEEEFKIGINDIPEEPNKFYVMAQYTIGTDVKEIIESCSYKEMLLAEFLSRHNYNNRLATNFNRILKDINKIGLNSRNYYMEE